MNTFLVIGWPIALVFGYFGWKTWWKSERINSLNGSLQKENDELCREVKNLKEIISTRKAQREDIRDREYTDPDSADDLYLNG